MKFFLLCSLVVLSSRVLAATPISNKPSVEQVLLGMQTGCQDQNISSLVDKSQQNIKAAVTECRCITNYLQPALIEIRQLTSIQSYSEKVKTLSDKAAEARSACKAQNSDAVWMPNLTGEWISEANQSCPEQISYLPNSQFSLRNNDEVITGRYTLSNQYTEGGRLHIEYFMQKSNEQFDCQGGKTLQSSLDPDHAAPNSGYLIIDQNSTRYLNFEEASGKSQNVIGPYYRIK